MNPESHIATLCNIRNRERVTMAKKLKTVIQTTDGKEFTDEREATRHQECIDALKAYEDARHQLLMRMSNEMRTADGDLFDGGDYFQIVGLGDWPRLRRVTSLGYYFQQFEQLSHGGLGLVEHDERYGRRIVEIADLYRSESKAKEALQAKMNERLEALHELREQVPEMRVGY